MTEHDTHCAACGGRLIPVPILSTFAWECPCGGLPPMRLVAGPFKNLIKVYGVGMKFRPLGYKASAAYWVITGDWGDGAWAYEIVGTGAWSEPLTSETLVEIVE